MVAFWEVLEVVERTPVVDQVATRRRGSSSKLNNLLNIFGGSLKRNCIEDSNENENENISILTEDSREGFKIKNKNENYSTLSIQGHLREKIADGGSKRKRLSDTDSNPVESESRQTKKWRGQ